MQRKSENINNLIQSKLNVRTVNEEFNQYDDLLIMVLDTHYQYYSKLEDSLQIEDGNWFDEVDQNIFTFQHLVLIMSKIMKKTVQENLRRAQKVRTHQYQVGQEAQVPVLP